MQKPIVSIGVVTYNQQKYISKCLDSLLFQQTSFQYEIIVADDCSIDGTTQVLKDYAFRFPNTIKLILNPENVGVAENYRILFRNLKGKYIMLCEGDDYWINPLKIQNFKYKEAKQQRGLISSKKYQNKILYRMFVGPITMFLLSIILRLKNKGKTI